MRDIISAMPVIDDSVIEEAALAWETAAYLASTVSVPDLIDGDLRFVPAFSGSQDIERSRTSAGLLADFRSAMVALHQPVHRASDDVKALWDDEGHRGYSGDPTLDRAPPGAAISAVDAFAMLNWIAALLERCDSSEGHRAWRAACRSVFFVCDAVGDASSCEAIRGAALQRLCSREDEAPELLGADLSLLHALSWCDATAVRRAENAGDKKATERRQEELKKTANAVLAIAPARHQTPLGQRAIGNIVRNACICLSDDKDSCKRYGEYLGKCLELHPHVLVLAYGFGLAISNYARRLHSTWARNPTTSLSEVIDSDCWEILDICQALLRRSIKVNLDSYDKRDRPQLIESWHSLAIIRLLQVSLLEKQTIADLVLRDLLVICEDKLSDSWSGRQLGDLAMTSGSLLLFQGPSSPQVLRDWFNWLLGPEREDCCLEGIITGLIDLLPSVHLDDDNRLDKLRIRMDARLDRHDVPTQFYPFGTSLHEALADAVVTVASHAYANSDRALFEDWAKLLERPDRNVRRKIDEHLARLATLRLGFGVTAGNGSDLRGPVGDEAGGLWSSEPEYLIAAYCAVEQRGELDEADAILDRLLKIGNVENGPRTR